MKFKRQLIELKTSICIIIPSDLVKHLNLKKGMMIDIEENNGAIKLSKDITGVEDEPR